jgi:hypothetical protein
MPVMARSDSAGASHDFVDALRELEIRFSVGFDLTEPARRDPGHARKRLGAIKQDGREREGARVCELVDLDLEGWPPGAHTIRRGERPHPGAQLSFTDHRRLTAFQAPHPQSTGPAPRSREGGKGMTGVQSGRIRTVIPVESGHAFRLKADS